jgi:ATP-dependent Clp protease ATP-binding subunit ClpC
MPEVDSGRSPASLDLAIAWLGRRIAEIAAAPPTGAAPETGDPVGTAVRPAAGQASAPSHGTATGAATATGHPTATAHPTATGRATPPGHGIGAAPGHGTGTSPGRPSPRPAVPSGAAAGAPPRSDLEAATAALEQLQAASEALARLTEATGEPAVAGTSAPAARPGATAAATPAASKASELAALPADAPVNAPPPVDAATATADGPRATPLLDEIGRDLTALAREGMLAPSIGRDTETARLVEALCRPTRPSAVLLGPEGIGKASIVEGLATRVVAGQVPAPLQDVRIVEVPISALVAGTQYRGQLEERLSQLVREASQPSLVLFIEGVDQLARAGRTEGGMGALEVLRGPLARGDLRLVGSAEAEAFRQASETSGLDELLTPIAVAELDRDATRPVLAALRDRLAKTSGVTVSDPALDVLLDFAEARILSRRFPDKAVDLLSEAIAAAIVAGRTTVADADAVAVTEAWSRRASATPTLDRLGRDLVGLARAGQLGPIVGREREIGALIGVLLRRTKRNPALIGPAGSGKTAIVEGLAIRIAGGDVPEALRDTRIHDIPLLGLAAAAETNPRVVEDLLQEARHPSVVVFFDEMHVLALPAVHDVAERLKPPLARGDIAVIGATTSEEYQQLIEPQGALARRFTIVPVEPMDAAAVRAVLVSVRSSLEHARHVTVDDAALDELVDLADRFLPNRAQPDKGVDLLEQSVTWAITHGRTSVDVAGAREAVAALVGMPLDPGAALAGLESELAARSLLDPAAHAALLGRLRVSLRGLDARRDQPDAVVLLPGTSAGSADALAALLASRLFGREGAVIDIDLAPMTEDSAISSLLGSAPGLVGSDRTLPLHTLRRSPWQVVLLRGIDACAVSIRDTVAAALTSGRFTDAMGRSIPLGAAIVLLTAPGLDASLPEAVLGAALGPQLLRACDAVAGGSGPTSGDRAAWVRGQLVAPLLERLTRAGYPATATDGLVTWIAGALPSDGTTSERWLDRAVTAPLLASLPAVPGPVVLDVDDAGPVLRPGS